MMTLDLINDLRIFLGGFSLSLSILKERAMAAVVGNQENHLDTRLVCHCWCSWNYIRGTGAGSGGGGKVFLTHPCLILY